MLLHLGPNVITFRTLLHLGQLLHLGLQHPKDGGREKNTTRLPRLTSLRAAIFDLYEVEWQLFKTKINILLETSKNSELNRN